MTQPMIEFRHVKKDFNGATAINDLNLSIENGELFVLVGTSGSGKTTTLKMINQLFVQTDGDILFLGKKIKDYNLRHLRLNIGYVLQQIALFPTMTVKQNISVILEMKKVSKKDIAARVDELLEQVNLDPGKYRDRYPHELSGGEQQRIGICRAIAANPPVILFDEPFSALDPIVRTQLQDLVLELHKKLNSTIVFVTHDMDEALKLGDRIGVMSHGDLLQVDTPQNIAQHPENEFVEDFFASTVGKNIYDTPVDKIVRTSFATADHSESTEYITVDSTTQLEEIFGKLVDHQLIEVVNYQTKQHEGWIDRQAIFRYLSETKH